MIDPDKMLDELRESSKNAIAHGNYDATILGQKFLALDGWLSKHGFPPKEWSAWAMTSQTSHT